MHPLFFTMETHQALEALCISRDRNEAVLYPLLEPALRTVTLRKLKSNLYFNVNLLPLKNLFRYG